MEQIFTGVAVRGDGRGRGLGFPTANMVVEQLELAEGIWASWCRLKDDTQWRAGALHVGPRPTYGDSRLSVELHILDFPDRDLYGETISFVPTAFIRGVEQFASEEDLRAAISGDCAQARELLVAPPLV